jgi:hypothetical protein
MLNIAVSGSTLYSDIRDKRFQTCMNFLRLTNEAGIPAFLADASPDPAVTEQLRSLATVVELRSAPFHAQKATALHQAYLSGAAALICTEFEKDDLVRYFQAICEPILSGTADLVIPKRSEKSWASYPREMQATEGFALDQIEKVTGRRWDTMFGPFAIHRDFATRFTNCSAPMWSWLHEPRFEMMRSRPHRIAEVEVDFEYPPQQCAVEEGNPAFHLKRLEQLSYTFGPLVAVYGKK